jgi:hypothetical protein
MSYPVLSRAKTIEYVLGRRNQTVNDAPPEPELRGPDDDDLDVVVNENLNKVIERWHAADPRKISSNTAKDALAGELSIELYEGFRDLPGTVLSDRDFWRYCAASLYDFVQWRIGENCQLTNYGAASDSVRDCLPHDMFQRAHIAYLGGAACGDPDPFALARLGASDVWRSHILRVQTGHAPVVAHELLSDVKAGKLKTDLVRDVAKRLKRARANLLFEILDQAQARELIDRETARADS